MQPRRSFALAGFLLVFFALPMFGQVCATGSKYATTIACQPTVIANKNVSNQLVYFNPVTGNEEHSLSLNSSLPVAVPLALGAQYASQISTSPSAATSTGYVFAIHNGALSTTPADLGPLFSDLPQTIGRNRLYIGTSYQWMQFTQMGGQNMKSFQYQETYTDSAMTSGIQGWHEAQASASLKVHSIDTYISYGIGNRIEVSAIIPWSHVSFGMKTSCVASDMTAGNSPSSGMEWGPDGNGGCYSFSDNIPIDVPGATPAYPWYDVYFYDPASGSQKDSGIGDVTLRGKYEFLAKSRQALAVGLEYRLPTGDPLNLLGSGAMGVRPFLAWSYNSRVSPHVNAGFQYNGSSINDVRDDVTYNSSNESYVFSDKLNPSKLPNTFTSSFGADLALSRRLNLDADLLERVFSNDGSKAFAASLPGPNNTSHPVPQMFSGAKDKGTVLVGGKGKLAGHLLFGLNVMLDVTGGSGMSYKPSPIATLSYDFGTSEK